MRNCRILNFLRGVLGGSSALETRVKKEYRKQTYWIAHLKSSQSFEVASASPRPPELIDLG